MHLKETALCESESETKIIKNDTEDGRTLEPTMDYRKGRRKNISEIYIMHTAEDAQREW